VKWSPGFIPLRLCLTVREFGQPDNTAFAESAETAARAWNEHVGTVQFNPEYSGSIYYDTANGINEIAFSQPGSGMSFDQYTLAVTIALYSSDGDSARTVETDIVVDGSRSWDIYQGDLREDAFDFQRVVLHELGHVLGLGHPDEAEPPQAVSALMNSTTSDLDDVTADDIAGAQALYGTGATVIRPDNNDFNTAAMFLLESGIGQVAATNLWADKEPFEPYHAEGEPGGASVWWKWIAPSSGSFVLSTAGSDFDTLLAVYTGSVINQLHQIAGNDDESASLRTSRVSFTATAGATYYFAVDGWAADTGQIVLRLTAGAASAAPTILSAATASVAACNVFFYQVTTDQNVTSYAYAGDLPEGLTFNTATGVISGRALETGTFTGVFTAGNVLGSATRNFSLTVTDAPPVVISGSSGLMEISHGGGQSLKVGGLSINGAISYQWMHDSRPIPGATGSTLELTNLTLADGGFYWANLTNEIGTTPSQPVFVRVRNLPYATQLVTWGSGATGQSLPATSLTDLVAISTGNGRVIGLRVDGSMVAVGPEVARSLPTSVQGFAAIAPRAGNILAVRPDGTVVSWLESGYNPALEVPVGLDQVVAVASAGSSSHALKADGTVVSWGGNNYGQTTMPAGLQSVAAIAAGEAFALALRRDGTVAAWGYNAYGQATVPAGLGNVTAIAAGRWHALALKADGTVVAWGNNTEGQRNIPAGLTNVVAIAAGDFHSMALKSDGTVVAWGRNTNGQSAPPSWLNNGFAIAGENTFSAALRVTTGDPAPMITVQPLSQTRLEEQSVVFSVTASGIGPLTYQWRKNGATLEGATSDTLILDALSLTDAGNYDVLVSNHAGTTPSAVATLEINPHPIITNLSPLRQAVQDGQSLHLSVNATGAGELAFQWTKNGRPIPGATGADFTVAAASWSDNGYYVAWVTDDHGTWPSAPFFVQFVPAVTRLLGWGYNTNGQISIPAGLTDVVGMSAGNSHSLALRADGTVLAWGMHNIHGETTVPDGLNGAVAVAAGQSYSMALRSNGTVAVWGSNLYQELNMPAGLSNVVTVAAGYQHALAVKSNGTVVAWGGAYGTGAAVPAGLTDVISVAGGGGHSLALKRDGTVVAWGENGNGQCNVPVGLADVVAIAAGGSHSLALKSDGTVTGWGANPWGQSQPPTGLTGVISIAAGMDDSMALKSDGTVVAWGQDYGGFATLTPRPSGLNGVIAISAGTRCWMALGDASHDTPPIIIAQPLSQARAEGQTVVLTVAAVGGGSYSYQWRKNETAIPSATSATLTLSNLSAADAGSYAVTVTNYLGSTPSELAVLTINPLPVVTGLGPKRQMLLPGASLQLQVNASGAGQLHYQWTRNGRAIPGANASNLLISGANLQDAGYYIAEVTDDFGMRRGEPCFVLVAPLATEVVGWGWSNGGRDAPAGLADAVAIGGGSYHGVALKRDGTVVAWGKNDYGQTNVPAGLSDVVAIKAGAFHTLALKSDGTVVAWGWNIAGQCNVPAGLEHVVAIATNSMASVAVKSDGTFVQWGNGVIVPAGWSDVVSFDSGDSPLALARSGAVLSNYSAPFVTVPVINNGVAIAARSGLNMALNEAGEVFVWGDLNTVPVGLGDVGQIAVGNTFCLALKENGEVMAWGSGSYGESVVPSGLSGVVAIAAGPYIALALRDATPVSAPVITAQPIGRSVEVAETVAFSATAEGYPAPSYQWQISGDDGETWLDLDESELFSNVNTNTLSIIGVTVALRDTRYRLLVGNTAGVVESVEAKLTILTSFAAWRETSFTNVELADANIAGSVADPDVDGLTNLLEYALGLDPKTANTTGLPEVSTTATDWVYTYTRPVDRPDLTYVAEVSTDLLNWSEDGVTHEKVSTEDDRETWRALHPLSSASSAFFRLKITQP
jgi:alpha-tubulin suppressor-like RCC1 family protein